ncbi:MAG: hypothetical protein OXP08_00885 [bacterium]|nr:hypothetical protein [bacterium]
MKETLLVITARNISGPLLAELAQWLGSSFTSPEHDDADAFLRQVWQEVGDDLRGAMNRYPLEQAGSDAGYSLSSSPT